ncbi:MAG: multicopper oxidase domain-containing protein [Planctomycetaceae bacterium]
MRRMRWSATALLLALSIVATACGGGSSDAGAAAGGGTSGERAAGGPTTVSVTLSDFTIDPATMTAPAGTAITFEVTNDGPAPHTFAVKTPDQTYDTGEIQANASATLQVPALAAGSYGVLCTVPGHEQLGMKGTLTVGATASTDGAATDGSGSMAGMPAVASAMPTMTAQQMADMHKEGVDTFVAQLADGPNTKGHGNQVLEPTIKDGVKVFDLTVSQVQWEVSPGQTVSAMAYNGQVPGPELDVHQGDKIQINVQNQMDQPTTVHFHGMTVPNAMDGVPYITQDPIMPGGYFSYRFTVKDPPGMYVYHSHFNSTEQVGSGLYGEILVEPTDGDWAPLYGAQPDVETTMFLGDGPLGYVINGKSFPGGLPIVAKQGDWVLIHMANDGSLLHPMHLHGYHFQVVGQDGFPLAPQNRYLADTLTVAPGARYDILVHAVYPGAWAFHCHILPHVEGPEGMYGMVSALVVQ